MVDTGGVCQQRDCFSFSRAFKTYTNPRGRQTQEIPTNNEQVGRGVGRGLGHPQATY
jgi:hypothetical protein